MYRFVSTEEEVKRFIVELQKANKIAFDIETTGLDFFTDKILLVQMKFNDFIYILDYRKIQKKYLYYIFSLIRDSKKTLVGHNIKFDLKFIGVNFSIFDFITKDTMLAEILINQGIGKQFYSLAELSSKYLNILMDKTDQVSFINYTEETFSSGQLIYSATDVNYLFEIVEKQEEILAEQNQLKVLDLENELTPVVVSMEINGVLIGKETWLELSEIAKRDSLIEKSKAVSLMIDRIDFSKFTDGLDMCDKLSIPITKKSEKEALKMLIAPEILREFFSIRFNLGSPGQVLAVLNDIGIDVKSTGDKILKDFVGDPVIDTILLFREYAKLASTYGENFFEIIHPLTGRIHVDFNQLGTSTGRFTVSRLHQIPKKNEYRRAFIARPGYKIITADYSQAELRLLGEVSRDKEIISAYKEGIDLHRKTAGFLFHKPPSEVIDKERQVGKGLNFAIVYGTTAYGIAFNFNIPVVEGQAYLDKFFAGYKSLDSFIKLAGDKIQERMYSVTPLGRKRFWEKKTMFKDVWEMKRYNKRIRREGINHIIQGGSADITKKAMINTFYNNPFGDEFRLLMQVHDEIVFEVREDLAEEAKQFISVSMLSAEAEFLKEIPCEIDTHIENYWSK